jgi:hypothetical protein
VKIPLLRSPGSAGAGARPWKKLLIRQQIFGKKAPTDWKKPKVLGISGGSKENREQHSFGSPFRYQNNSV